MEMIYAVGDFVYLKPRSIFECFYIARILEIRDDQVHVNWFYRSRDLYGRGDARELIASMDSDWNSLSSVESKVVVKHQYQIEDLKLFKSLDSCFYYDKLYDKYTKRTYQVVPLNQINNLPIQYKSLIKSEFLLIEEKSQKKFTQRRNCAACETWVNPTESNVVCTNCRRGFHLGCVGLKKELPKRGYGWECGLCTRVKQDDSCSDLTEFSDLSEEEEEFTAHKIDVGNQNKWPWRYFGDHSRLEDLLNDPEGRPKAGSRIGRNFQAVDLPSPGDSRIDAPPIQVESENKEIQYTKARGRGRPRKSDINQPLLVKEDVKSQIQGAQGVRKKDRKRISEHELLIPERSNEVEFSPHKIPEKDCEFFLLKIVMLYIERIHAQYKISNPNAELIHVSLSYLHKCDYNTDEAFNSLSARSLIELVPDEWISQDIILFENCFLEHGMDLSRFKNEIPHKSMKEIVSFFYKWKNTPRFISSFNQHSAKTRIKKSNDQKVVVALSDLNSDASSESDAESVADIPIGVYCGICKATRSESWSIKHVPKKVFLCTECDLYWKKYGIVREIDTSKKPSDPIRKEQVTPLEESAPPVKRILLKLESPDSKKKREILAEQESVSKQKQDLETEEESKSRPCAVCSENLPSDNQMLVCVDCKLKVHGDCYGRSSYDENFRCNRCMNVKSPEISVNYSCVLCQKAFPNKLSAVTKTIGNNWAHLICSIWIPEVKFGDVSLMKPVECIGHIDPNKWQTVGSLSNEKKMCVICTSSDGVTLQCCDRNCSTYVHASCALLSSEYVTMMGPKRGSDLAFEPLVFCMTHSKKWKNKSALEEPQSHLIRQYVLQNKAVPVQLHTIGGKRAYSSLLNDTCECHISTPLKIPKTVKISQSLLQSAVENRECKSCVTCSSDLSPYWWPVSPPFDADGHLDDSGKPLFQCQRCKWDDNICKINR